MIRFSDAAVLAYTKLRTHRLRTGLTVGLAGILFGVILATIFFVQGAFDSVARFSDEGLNNRAILSVSNTTGLAEFNPYDHAGDASFIAEVEAQHKAVIDKKTAAAKKHGIEYDPRFEDPSPIQVDSKTKQRSISEDGMRSIYVEAAATARHKAETKPFDIHEWLRPYKTARVLDDNIAVMPEDGNFTYMKNGVEARLSEDESASDDSRMPDSNQYVTVFNGSLTKPFISNTSFDPAKGEIPVVLPYGTAEKLLGLKQLDKTASNQAKLDRLHEVRSRIGEVTASYCYRNSASQRLLEEAINQADELQRMKDTPGYEAPALQYAVPAADSCGAVRVTRDVRTSADKQQAANRIAYEKEIGTYLGEPQQQKINMRGVGISSDYDTGAVSSVGEMVKSLLASNLGYGNWVVPADLLRQVPERYRPSALFKLAGDTTEARQGGTYWSYVGYMVEFDDKQEARAVLERTGVLSSNYSGNVSAMPFGSGTLVIDEMKTWFAKFMFWALIIVGGIAAVILGGIIGRTVSEGRRESAVFRAIGAKRADIAGIYGVYALLLSLRVVVFAMVLGVVISLTVELLYWRDATLGARLAYASSDTSLEFHLFSMASWYVPLIIGVILVVGLLGSIVPIVRNARRNPINDMRDE